MWTPFMNSLTVSEILRQSGNRIERRIRLLTPFLTTDCRWIASSLSRCYDSCCAVHCQWWRDHLNAAICRMLRARFCLFFWGALQVIELIHAALFWRFSWRHFCRVFACDWELIHAAICRMLTVSLLRFLTLFLRSIAGDWAHWCCVFDAVWWLLFVEICVVYCVCFVHVRVCRMLSGCANAMLACCHCAFQLVLHAIEKKILLLCHFVVVNVWHVQLLAMHLFGKHMRFRFILHTVLSTAWQGCLRVDFHAELH